MMMNPRDKELIHAKQEGRCDTAAPAAFSTSSSSTQWSGFKNPRIVRVTRTFGGKDRHSKVSTIRGLRDRRIRLSVPTAIQLYDLQDRLGLSQPSKVIDWLLQATKHDIDGLPPLQIPPGSFGFHRFQHHHHHPPTTQLGCSTNHYHPAAALQQPSSFSPFLDANLTLMNNVGAPDSLYSNSSASAAKDGDININHDLDMNEEDEEREDQDDDDDRLSLEAKLEKINYWNIRRSSTEEDDRHQYGGARAHGTSSSTGGNDTNHNNNNNSISGSTRHPAPFPQKFFPVANHNNTTSFFPMAAGGGGGGLFNNTVHPHGYYHCDPSNLSLSQFGGINNNDNLPISQADNHHAVPLPSSSAPYGSPQLYFCPPSPNMTASLAFPLHSSYNINRQHDHEQIGNMRQISRFQLSSANSYPSFHTNDEHHGKPRKND